jgi:hypothetical protein
MGTARAALPRPGADVDYQRERSAGISRATEDPVSDVIYVALTIAVFAALWLLVKGVERIER